MTRCLTPFSVSTELHRAKARRAPQNEPWGRARPRTAGVKGASLLLLHDDCRFNLGRGGSSVNASSGKQEAEQGLPSPSEASALELRDSLQGASIYLVGMMGSGKSTVGKLVASALGYMYFDTDEIVEGLMGKEVAEVIADIGIDDFREIETKVLSELSAYKSCVVATGGGIPTVRVNWSYMQQGVVVWLRGDSKLLAKRVIREGLSKRPLLSSAGAEGEEDVAVEIHKLMMEREQQYANADLTIELAGEPDEHFGAPPDVIAARVLSTLKTRIAKDARERDERKNFQVHNSSSPQAGANSINPAPHGD